MAIPIIPILKFIAVQVLVPIAIEKAPVLIDKIGKKLRKGSQESPAPTSQNEHHFPTNTQLERTPLWKSQNH